MTLESVSVNPVSPGSVAHPVRLAEHRSRRPVRPATVLVLAVEGVLDLEWPRGVLDAHGLNYRHLSVAELAGSRESIDPSSLGTSVDLDLDFDASVSALHPDVSDSAAVHSDALDAVDSVPVAPRTRLQAGELVMDLDEMRVRVTGEPIALTHQEFLLLQTFLENPGRLFSRQQLLEQAWDYAGWGNDWGSGRTVDVHVRRLRVKLGDAAPIATVRGFGYRFEPPRETAA